MRRSQHRWAGYLAVAVGLVIFVVVGRLSAQTSSPVLPAPIHATAPVDQIVPRLFATADGEVLRMWQTWVDLRAGGGGVFVSMASPPDAWTRLLESRPREAGVNEMEPDLALGSGKDIAVAYQWRRHAPRTKEVRVVTSSDGGKTWSRPATAVESSGKGFTPKLAWGRGRSLVVVWMDERRAEKAWDIYARRSPDGGMTWEPEQMLSRFSRSTNADLAARPEIIGDGQDRFWCVWIGLRNGQSRFYLSRSVDGGKTWTDPLPLSGQSESVFGQRLLRAGEHLLLVWQDARTGKDRIYSVASADGGVTWTEPTRVDHVPSDSQFSAGPPAAVLAPDGEAFVTWHDGRNGRDDVFVTRSADSGRTWAAEDIRMDADDAGTAMSRYPKISRAGDGRLAVAWEDDRNGFEAVYARIRSAGQAGAWGPEIAVSSPAKQKANRAPSVVWGPGGALYVAWDVWDFSGGQEHPGRQIDGRVIYPDKN